MAGLCRTREGASGKTQSGEADQKARLWNCSAAEMAALSGQAIGPFSIMCMVRMPGNDLGRAPARLEPEHRPRAPLDGPTVLPGAVDQDLRLPRLDAHTAVTDHNRRGSGCATATSQAAIAKGTSCVRGERKKDFTCLPLLNMPTSTLCAFARREPRQTAPAKGGRSVGRTRRLQRGRDEKVKISEVRLKKRRRASR